MKKQHYDITYPNPVPEGVTLEKNIYVTMRDGIRMALDIYKPARGKGPWPVILAYSSFAKERLFESAKPAYYCKRGYICVQAAERGVGLSQGQFGFQGATAAEDGYDIIEWLAAQPWCSGKVAMMGASGYGVMQWMTALLNPPHLKALVVLGTTDNYRGLCYPGGVLRKPFLLSMISGMIMGAIWPGPVEGKEAPADVINGILIHSEDDAYWQGHGSTWKNIGKIKVPALNLVQAPNRLHAAYHLRSYNDLKCPKKLIMVPWTNENYQPWIFETIAFNQQIQRWLDYWLKGIDTGILEEPEIAVYDNGTGNWRYEKEYPLARTQWEKFYLHSGGGIKPNVPAKTEKPDIYHNISLNLAMKDSYGIVEKSDPSNVRYVTYLSQPLKSDLRVWGPISLTLYASTQEEVTSDWCFFVKMGEMAATGAPLNPVTGLPEIKPEINDPFTPPEVQIWSWGSLKAKYRKVDEKKSLPGAPWHPFKNPEDLQPNTIYEFQIEMQPTFKTFKKGCRIWLKIAGDDAVYTTRDSSSQFVEIPVSQTKNEIAIYHNAQYPSHLVLPVIPDVPEITKVKVPLRNAVPGAARINPKSQFLNPKQSQITNKEIINKRP